MDVSRSQGALSLFRWYVIFPLLTGSGERRRGIVNALKQQRPEAVDAVDVHALVDVGPILSFGETLRLFDDNEAFELLKKMSIIEETTTGPALGRIRLTLRDINIVTNTHNILPDVTDAASRRIRR